MQAQYNFTSTVQLHKHNTRHKHNTTNHNHNANRSTQSPTNYLLRHTPGHHRSASQAWPEESPQREKPEMPILKSISEGMGSCDAVRERRPCISLCSFIYLNRTA
jgi:hypothetical protein